MKVYLLWQYDYPNVEEEWGLDKSLLGVYTTREGARNHHSESRHPYPLSEAIDPATPLQCWLQEVEVQ